MNSRRNFIIKGSIATSALLAAKPIIPEIITEFEESKSQIGNWQGASVKNIETLGEQSALGLKDTKGVYFMDVPINSLAEKNGFKKGDVLLKFGESQIQNLFELFIAEFPK